jgi:hypothetical protein
MRRGVAAFPFSWRPVRTSICAVTKVTTYAVLLLDRDGETYKLEATYRGLTRPSVDCGPYLAQEAGVVFFVERIENDRIFGWRAQSRAPSGT